MFAVALRVIQFNYNLKGLVFKIDLPSKRSYIERTCIAPINITPQYYLQFSRLSACAFSHLNLTIHNQPTRIQTIKKCSKSFIQNQTFMAVFTNVF